MTQPNLDGIPDLPFTSKEFKQSWEDWTQHRKEAKKALTATTKKYQLRKLAAMGEARALAALEHSISGGYQGIYEPSVTGQPQADEQPGEAFKRRMGL